MDTVSKDLRCQEFFGHIPARFCAEIRTILYNEFLTAAQSMREKLVQIDSSKDEEIYSQLSYFLFEIEKELDIKCEQFSTYFYQNYVPNPSIPLHGEDVDASAGATDRLSELRMKLKATDKLNNLLMEKIDLLQVEIEKRQKILATLVKQKEELHEIQKAREMIQSLRTQSDKVLIHDTTASNRYK